MEIVGSMASTVVELLFHPIRRSVSPVVNYSRNVKSLETHMNELSEKKNRVRHSVEDDVVTWLASVDAITEKADRVLKDEEKAKKRCFMGLFPNLMTRYRVSTEIKSIEEEAVKISLRGKFESRRHVLDEILEALKDNDVNLVGVYGMAGVGKTTIVKKVAEQVKANRIFDVVVLAVVSKTPDLRKIQGEIADGLGFELKAETIRGRAEQLRKRLERETKVLVILDDIWERLELDDVGIPCGSDNRGCKILMTSRDRNALYRGMDTKKLFHLQVLLENEAWNLFKNMAGDAIKNPDLQLVAVEVAKRCYGLPILLVTAASALKGGDVSEWKDALERLKRFDKEDIDSRVYSALELSYTSLKGEEIKSVFLLCGQLIPHHIPIHDLLKYTVGLGLFKRISTLEEARHRVNKLVNDLIACRLLEGGADGIVKMHDVVHGFASVASRDHHVFTSSFGEWLDKDMLEQYSAISLLGCKISGLPEVLNCPKLESFILYNEDPSLKIPDCLFKGTKTLQLMDMTGVELPTLPSSLQFLEMLQTLCLNSCGLEDIALIGELKMLKVLSLTGSNIVRLPREFGQLTRLQLLDLRDNPTLEIIPPNVLSCLTQLEDLYMENSFLQWGVEGVDDRRNNASLAELKDLPYLSTLYLHITDPMILPKDFFSKKLERFNILIGEGWEWSSKRETSTIMKLKISASIQSEEGIQLLLKRTEDLHLDGLEGVKSVSYELDGQGFPSLKHLHIQNSLEIRYIVDSTMLSPIVAFPFLVSLSLDNLNKLEKICNGQPVAESFSKLRILKVKSCPMLKNLFSLHMERGLLQLEEIVAEESGGEADEDEAIKLTQLRTLTLEYLPQFTSVSSKSNAASMSQTRPEPLIPDVRSKEIASDTGLRTPMTLFNKKIEFPNLEDLKLSSIEVEKIWQDQPGELSCWFVRLTSLIVEGCRNLKYLFTTSMVESLAQLKRLDICDCVSMEEIIIKNGLGEEENVRGVMLPKLQFLKLKGLPNLTRFCTGHLIQCCFLQELWIEDCPALKTFISNSLSTDAVASNQFEETNSTLFDEKVAFSNIKELRILGMDNLNMIWHTEFHSDSFCKLKVLKVKQGNKLLNIFPPNMLRRFQNLELLVVDSCASLEEVFDLRSLMNEKEYRVVTAFKLKNIYVWNLQKLKKVWNTNPHGILSFQNLHSVNARNCPSLKSLYSHRPSISRTHVFDEILEALEDNDVNLVGVYGMAGVGKTTIVKKVAEQVMANRIFDVVVLAVVSKTPDLKKIQGEIADGLGFKFEAETIIGRAERLRERLERETKVLVILDDIWERLELDDVGIPSGSDNRGCKILMTSRDRNALYREMDTKTHFHLKGLPWNEAWSLFESRRHVLDEILEALKDNDVNLVGVYGMPGVGKTTIVKKVAAQVKANRIFDVVVLAVVSKTPDLKKIQGEIADGLGFKFEAETIIGRAERLRERLERETKVLVILDDIWERLELDDVGIPSGSDNRGCKILMTSRDRNALYREMDTKTLFHLKGLPRNEALNLFESRRHVFYEILEALKDNDVNLVGVYGMPGVGKTTIVKKVAAQVKANRIFDVVVLAVVSKTPDLREIQGEIADGLGFELKAETIRGRAEQLRKRLERETKVLVILDDIWERLELDDVGIPSGSDHRGCKILMTSRDRNALYRGMDTKKLFHLQVLLENEAWNLFKNMAGDAIKNPDLQPVAVEVAKRCAALPILLVTVASALKDGDLSEWKDALERLERFDKEDIDSRVYSALELSYTSLKGEEIKSVFLLCGQLRPHYIPIHDLLKYTVGLGLFKHISTLEEARHGLNKLVNDLIACCLLEGGADGIVKMHDVLHRFAASKDHRVFTSSSGTVLREWSAKDMLEQYSAISLLGCKISELPEVLNCPKMESFILYNVDPSLKIPDCLFKGTKTLQLMDMSDVQLPTLPSSLQFLEKLQTLCLDRCGLGDIALIGELKMLKVLSLMGSSIDRLPREIRQLTRLQLLDLRDNPTLEIIPPNVLSCLTQLEDLYMENSFLQWGVEGLDDRRNNASLAELKDLPYLSTLYLHITDPMILPKDFFSKKLERFNILIGEGWEWSSKRETSTIMKLKISASIQSEEGIQLLLKRTEDLHLDGLGVKSVSYELDGQGFPSLKHLHIQNSLEIRYIVDWTMLSPIVDFPFLVSLSLDNLNNLEKICNGQPVAESFSKLRILKVKSCPMLKNLFSLHMQRGLLQLEEISIIDCEIMEVIVAEESGGEADEDEAIKLTQLRTLTLEYLPQFTSVSSKSNAASISQTRPKPLITDVRSNSLAPSVSTFGNLTALHVRDCKALKYLVTSSTARSLVQLSVMSIKECKMVTEIVASNGDEAGNEIIFRKLQSLKLDCLDSLTSFCPVDFTFRFPRLTEVIVTNCPEMKTFSLGILSTPKLRKVWLSEEKDKGHWKGDLNITIQQLHI